MILTFDWDDMDIPLGIPPTLVLGSDLKFITIGALVMVITLVRVDGLNVGIGKVGVVFISGLITIFFLFGKPKIFRKSGKGKSDHNSYIYSVPGGKKCTYLFNIVSLIKPQLPYNLGENRHVCFPAINFLDIFKAS